MASENIMHLIGYSNPTKLTFGIACNIIVEKISAENIGGDMLRGGDYACLVQRAGNTVRRGIAVEPRWLDLSMHKNTGKTTINKSLMHNKCNAQTHDDMIV